MDEVYLQGLKEYHTFKFFLKQIPSKFLWHNVGFFW